MIVPNASGAVLGECGNDGLFFQVEYPLDTVCDIDFVKPSIFLGDLTPTTDFRVNDQIESVVNDFRTGDVRSSLNAFAPFGWVLMQDGTIGSPTSGATARANKDTFPLYKLLYTAVSDTYAPVIGGRTGSGTTDAEAITDFTLNKPITLTKILGRVLGSAGAGAGLTARALGETAGVENVTLSLGQIPNHTHTVGNTILGENAAQFRGGDFGQIGNTESNGITGYPGASPLNLLQPTSFVNMLIKL